jgi:hypothetical protein
MQTDGPTGAVTITDGDVRLTARLLSTQRLRFSQSSAFTVPPESPENTAYQGEFVKFPDQWHLKAHTNTPAAEIKFLAVLIPYRSSEPEPRIVPFGSGSAAGFRIGDSKVTAWWGPGETGRIASEGSTVEGRMVISAVADGKLQTMVCH